MLLLLRALRADSVCPIGRTFTFEHSHVRLLPDIIDVVPIEANRPVSDCRELNLGDFISY